MSKLIQYIKSIESGLRPIGGVNTEDGDIPSLGGENIVQSGGLIYDTVKLISKGFYETLNRGKLQEGDVLINKDGANTGKVGIYYPAKFEEAAINEHLFLLRSFPDELDQFYLYYTLLSSEGQKQIFNQITGSAQPGLNANFISKFNIKLFPLPTQRKIARILSTADAVIEKTGAAIAKYKAIKQGMLHDLFTRGVISEKVKVKSEKGEKEKTIWKLRPKYEDAPHLYKQSKLGWIPKEWEVEPLELFTTQVGDGIHTTPKYSENTDYYFVNGNNLSQGHILIGEKALCVNEEEYKKHFIELNERTILYSINGTIGNIAIYKGEKIILGKSACYISCKKNVNLEYIYFFLQSFQVSMFYDNELTGSTIKNLSLASIRNTPITIPNDETEQNLIADKILSISNKIESEETYLKKLQQIKAGLMADLLSGKVKVNSEK